MHVIYNTNLFYMSSDELDRNLHPNVTNAPAMDGTIFINLEKPSAA